MLRNGFKYYDTFGYIAALSSALNIFELPVDMPGRCLFHEDGCFGALGARNTDKNPRVALQNLNRKAKEDPNVKCPKIYMACGLQERLIEVNRIFWDLLQWTIVKKKIRFWKLAKVLLQVVYTGTIIIVRSLVCRLIIRYLLCV